MNILKSNRCLLKVREFRSLISLVLLMLSFGLYGSEADKEVCNELTEKYAPMSFFGDKGRIYTEIENYKRNIKKYSSGKIKWNNRGIKKLNEIKETLANDLKYIRENNVDRCEVVWKGVYPSAKSLNEIIESGLSTAGKVYETIPESALSSVDGSRDYPVFTKSDEEYLKYFTRPVVGELNKAISWYNAKSQRTNINNIAKDIKKYEAILVEEYRDETKEEIANKLYQWISDKDALARYEGSCIKGLNKSEISENQEHFLCQFFKVVKGNYLQLASKIYDKNDLNSPVGLGDITALKSALYERKNKIKIALEKQIAKEDAFRAEQRKIELEVIADIEKEKGVQSIFLGDVSLRSFVEALIDRRIGDERIGQMIVLDYDDKTYKVIQVSGGKALLFPTRDGDARDMPVLIHMKGAIKGDYVSRLGKTFVYKGLGSYMNALGVEKQAVIMEKI
ncbi:hypothetical protein KFE80_03515 [bacterium SCSIO 12696]|nr:hypothetical protein KFE80_03515 [bacterium SCSIO 12696]